ncbi:hypothetical protein [Methylobacterium phyllosphaerae]|uniref:hypothetical protein n=2 Tax=Methylobacterium TaxID=407 RepID=UPI000A5E694C|nr:hypothetical protein [Methylobacterium phyllosphaerae]
MKYPNMTYNIFADDSVSADHIDAAAAVIEEASQRNAQAAADTTPPPGLIEAAEIAGIFARSQSALDLVQIDSTYGSVEQCLERVWPRVQRRRTLIAAGLDEMAADTLQLQTLRHEVALEDAWQRFEGQPEEREALFAMYASLVSHLAWPKGFSRHELLETFMLE